MDIVFWVLLAGAVIGLVVNFSAMLEEFDDEDKTEEF